MAFSVNVSQRTSARSRSGSATSPKTALVVLLVLFAIFCAWDYSPYGGGYVASSLGAMQRSFQGFIYGFRIRM